MSDAVFLTFDDGPDREWTPRILDVLAKAEARATFFMIGTYAQACPQIVQRVLAEGHTIGNHTLSHRHPWLMTSSTARREVHAGTALLADIAGVTPRHFRPPHGRLRSAMVEEAASLGQATVLWDRSAIDWGPRGDAAGIGSRLRRLQPGEILLMHDGSHGINRTNELYQVLPRMIDEWQSRGMRCRVLF